MTVVLAGCGLVVRRSVTALRSSTSIPIRSGHDRGIGIEPLAAGRSARDTPALVLVIPGSGPRIQAAIEAAGPAAWRWTPSSCRALRRGSAPAGH